MVRYSTGSAPAAGKLTARSLCAVIAHMQPEGAVVVDESLTTGGEYWDLSKVSHTQWEPAQDPTA